MKRVIIRDQRPIAPFDEPARDLRVLNKPLWLLQRDLLARHCRGVEEVDSLDELRVPGEELLAYKDNLFFNAELIDTFIAEARASNRPRQLAFAPHDKGITTHALQLQEGIRLHASGCYVADLFYLPAGLGNLPAEAAAHAEPLVVDTQAAEMGYYHIPNYMAKRGDLVFQVPRRALLSIESWVHVFIASSPFGVFSQARELEFRLERGRLQNWREWLFDFDGPDWQAFRYKMGVSLTAFWERLTGPRWRNHFLASSKLVQIGKNCSIDPTAVIHGPTIIGDNVYIGAGTVITNSVIGSNVNIMQGCQVMLSVVSDRCYLPFNAALFMTTLMDNSMVAQNSTLQLCVVGRNTFIGANNVFTDFDLLGNEIQTMHDGRLQPVGLAVLGSAVGHNVKIGSGFLVYPGRMIGSGAVLIHADPERVIERNVPSADDDGQTQEAVYKWPQQFERDADGRLQPKDSQQLDQPLQFQALSAVARPEPVSRRAR